MSVRECRYGVKCHRPDCYFAHPQGRDIDRRPMPSQDAPHGGGRPHASHAPAGGHGGGAGGPPGGHLSEYWFADAMNCKCCSGFKLGCKSEPCASRGGVCQCQAGAGAGASGPAPSPAHAPAPAAVSAAPTSGYAPPQPRSPVDPSGEPPFSPTQYQAEFGFDEAAYDPEDDGRAADEWYPQYQNCSCCKGYIYGCGDATCESLGACTCSYSHEGEAQ